MPNETLNREVVVLRDDDDFLLGMREAAKFLGKTYWGLHTFYLRHPAEAPARFLIGTKWYIRLGELREWIAERARNFRSNSGADEETRPDGRTDKG